MSGMNDPRMMLMPRKSMAFPIPLDLVRIRGS